MINEMLKNPIIQKDPPPRDFCVEDFPSQEERRKRVRLWGFNKNNPRILPWICLNPSGKRNDGKGRTGRSIVKFSWRWGFDGCAVYNIYPFETSDPKRLDLTDQAAIQENHRYVAEDLRGVDAAVVAWGSPGGQFGTETWIWARELLKAIDDADLLRGCAFHTWCLRITSAGHPTHPRASGEWRRNAMPHRIQITRR